MLLLALLLSHAFVQANTDSTGTLSFCSCWHVQQTQDTSAVRLKHDTLSGKLLLVEQCCRAARQQAGSTPPLLLLPGTPGCNVWTTVSSSGWGIYTRPHL